MPICIGLRVPVRSRELTIVRGVCLEECVRLLVNAGLPLASSRTVLQSEVPDDAIDQLAFLRLFCRSTEFCDKIPDV